MNDFLDIKRFGAYAARDYRSHWKKYALMAGSLLGLLLLELIITKISHGKYFDATHIRNLVEINFSFIMAVCVVFFTISVMKPMKGRHTLAVENTVPASVFEKYLFILLNTTVVFFAMFFFIYLLMALFGIGVFGVGTLKDYFHNSGGIIYRFILWLALPLQAVAMYAGTMERRRHILSLLLVGVAVIAGLMFFVGGPIFIHEKFDTVIHYGPLFMGNTGTIHLADTAVTYGLSDIANIRMDGPETATCLAVVGVLIGWVAAWFNFKERSVK